MAAKALAYRPPLVVPAREAHTGTVIMLHGLGDSGDGWSSISMEFASALKHVKFIFPHAPTRRITLNMGMAMPGWYDVSSLEDINQEEDKEGLFESMRYVNSLVAEEAAAGVPSHRVVVAGFSQGGAVALMMLRSDTKLAAVVGMSTYLPLRNDAPVVSGVNTDTPLLLCHGTYDNVVDYNLGVNTFNSLKQLGLQVEFKSYQGMAHSACPQELEAVKNFIKQHLP